MQLSCGHWSWASETSWFQGCFVQIELSIDIHKYQLGQSLNSYAFITLRINMKYAIQSLIWYFNVILRSLAMWHMEPCLASYYAKIKSEFKARNAPSGIWSYIYIHYTSHNKSWTNKWSKYGPKSLVVSMFISFSYKGIVYGGVRG